MNIIGNLFECKNNNDTQKYNLLFKSNRFLLYSKLNETDYSQEICLCDISFLYYNDTTSLAQDFVIDIIKWHVLFSYHIW